MSFKAMAWAADQKPPTATAKLALLMMASMADRDTNRCWPSYQRLADDCMVSRATMGATLKTLKELGYISIENRFNKDGQTSNIYTLNVDRVEPKGIPGKSESPESGHPPSRIQTHPRPESGHDTVIRNCQLNGGLQEPCQDQPPAPQEFKYLTWRPSPSTIERLQIFHRGISEEFIEGCVPEFTIWAEEHNYRPDVMQTKFFKSCGSDWKHHNLNAQRNADKRKTANQSSEMPDNPNKVCQWAVDNNLPAPNLGEQMEEYKQRLARYMRDAA